MSPVEAPASTEKATPKVEKAEVNANIERWWSSRWRNHMVAIPDDAGGSVKFSGYSLELNLEDPRDRKVSEALHACGQEGKDIFVIGKEYPENEIGKQTHFMKKMREAVAEGDGIERVRALFTRRELVKAGLSAVTEDVDALMMLALKTKSLKGDF